MNTTHTPGFSSVLAKSAGFAMQWRLLLLWIVVLMIPTAIMTLPLWQIIASQLNYTVNSSALANHLNMNAISDIMSVMADNKLLLQQASLGAMVFTLLLSPFLSGAIVTAARAPAPLAMGKLMHGGIAEYWRMFRMLVLAMIVLGIAGAIGSAAMHWADTYAENAILEASADRAAHIAMAVMIILLVIADASLDAGRAQFVHSTSRRSALKAWWTGFMMLVKHPLRTLGLYVILTLAGLVLAAVFGLLRIHVNPVGSAGFFVGLVLTQLLVASTAWMKCSRIFALASVSK